MTTTSPPEDLVTIRRGVAKHAIDRMKVAWPARKWTVEAEAEYGRALMSLADPELITEGTTEAIRTVTGNFPPSVADLLAICDTVRARAITARAPTRQPDITIRSAALTDAINALEVTTNPREREHLEADIQRLRSRFSDRGAKTDTRMGDHIRHVRAEPHPDEPPDLVRLVVLLPDGTRRPRAARVHGEGRDRIPRIVPGVPQKGMALPDSHRDEFPRGPLNGGSGPA